MIPGSGRSAGEGIGHPLQYSWASLVAQLVKNPPAMQETWVRSLSWEDPLETGKATHTGILAWRIPQTIQPMGLQSWTQLSDFHFHNALTLSHLAPGGSVIKNLPTMQETWVQSLGWEHPLEKRMTAHSSSLTWRIPWTENPGGLQSMESWSHKELYRGPAPAGSRGTLRMMA